MNIDAINEAAMEIILHAGDGRELIRKAVKALEKGDVILFNTLMDEATNKLNKAHVAQTKVIQTSIEAEKNEFSILFTHAMDTLMTIKSEAEITLNFANLFK